MISLFSNHVEYITLETWDIYIYTRISGPYGPYNSRAEGPSAPQGAFGPPMKGYSAPTAELNRDRNRDANVPLGPPIRGLRPPIGGLWPPEGPLVPY